MSPADCLTDPEAAALARPHQIQPAAPFLVAPAVAVVDDDCVDGGEECVGGEHGGTVGSPHPDSGHSRCLGTCCAGAVVVDVATLHSYPYRLGCSQLDPHHRKFLHRPCRCRRSPFSRWENLNTL